MREKIQIAEQFKALGDPVRLKILQLLPSSPNCDQSSNVSQLAGKLGVPQPTISHHLKVLRQAGLVANKKMCRDVFYWIDLAHAATVCRELQTILKTAPLLIRKNDPLWSGKEVSTPL